MNEFETNLYRELEKLHLGSGSKRPGPASVDPRLLVNINDFSETVATLFDFNKDSTLGVIILVTVCASIVTVKCELHARFCDLAVELTQQLIQSGHLKNCLKNTASPPSPDFSTNLPKVYYSILEIRVIQTNDAPHFHRVLWLKANFDTPRPDDTASTIPSLPGSPKKLASEVVL